MRLLAEARDLTTADIATAIPRAVAATVAAYRDLNTPQQDALLEISRGVAGDKRDKK